MWERTGSAGFGRRDIGSFLPQTSLESSQDRFYTYFILLNLTIELRFTHERPSYPVVIIEQIRAWTSIFPKTSLLLLV